MNRKLLLILLIIPFFFSCKRSDNIGNSYSIDGAHDVNLSTAETSFLQLSIHHEDNAPQEPVTISVEGLPVGVTADIETASGTPSFMTKVTFINNLSSPAGTYAVKLVATSASERIESDINLVVPVLDNGWTSYDRMFFYDWGYADTTRPTNSISCQAKNDYGQIDVYFNENYIIPRAGGAYKIVARAAADNEVSVVESHQYANLGYASFSQQFGDTLYLSYDGNEYALKGTSVKLLRDNYIVPVSFTIKGIKRY